MMARAFESEGCSVSPDAIDRETEYLDNRRLIRRAGLSGIVLAGGRSSRMGTDKAGLSFRGMTLLEWQVSKLQRLGIEEIIISGSRGVRDVFPGRGPLGGQKILTDANKAGSVRELLSEIDYGVSRVCADRRELINCNYPEDYNIAAMM